MTFCQVNPGTGLGLEGGSSPGKDSGRFGTELCGCLCQVLLHSEDSTEAPGLPARATLALTNWTWPVSLPGEHGARRMRPAQGPDTDPSDQRPWWAASSTGNVTILQGRDPTSWVTL